MLIFLIKVISELVTVVNSVNSRINIDVYSYVKVRPVICTFSRGSWNFMSFKKHSLRNATVLNLWLSNINCVVFQMIINHTLSHSVIFIFILND